MDNHDMPLPPSPPIKRKKEDDGIQGKFDGLVEEGRELIAAANQDMDDLDSSRREIQSAIEAEFKRLREVIDSAEVSLHKNLEEVYNAQDDRLHKIVHSLQNAILELHDIITNATSQSTTNNTSNINNNMDGTAAVARVTAEGIVSVRRAFDHARSCLMMKHAYRFVRPPHELRLGDYHLESTVAVRAVPFAPIEVTTGPMQYGAVRLRWDSSVHQNEQLEAAGLAGAVRYQVQTQEHGSNTAENVAECTVRDVMYFPAKLAPCKRYDVRVRAGCKGVWSPWSKPTVVTVPEWARWCAWKECPATVDPVLAYKVSGATRRWATQTGDYWCTVVGNTPLARDSEVTWGTKIIVSKDRNGAGIFVGVAPEDINQSEDENFEKCGWYVNCGDFMLRSGPPHSYGYDGLEYGPRKKYGCYVTTGDAVMSVVNTKVGTLSFSIHSHATGKREDMGIAYKGIPLDKPLVPAVIMFYKKDAIELLI